MQNVALIKHDQIVKAIPIQVRKSNATTAVVAVGQQVACIGEGLGWELQDKESQCRQSCEGACGVLHGFRFAGGPTGSWAQQGNTSFPSELHAQVKRNFVAMASGLKAAFHMPGCKLNFSETSTLARNLSDAGYARVHLDDAPDVVVINTCSVTDHADAKCRNAVRRAMQSNPHAFVVVVGCYAQLKPDEIAQIEGVDLVLGAGEKFNPAQHLEGAQKTEEARAIAGEIKEVRAFVPGFSSGDGPAPFSRSKTGATTSAHSAPYPSPADAPGSATVAETVLQAEKAIASGAKEIVLTGVNIGDFGTAHGETLLDLVVALDALPGVERYRISSIEPNLLTDELIDFVSTSKRFQPHFHIPLQSGSDEVLSAMRRRYRTELYASRIQRIRNKMPRTPASVWT